jgi:hypothetical protein
MRMLSRLLQANLFVPIARALRRRILKCFSQARKKTSGICVPTFRLHISELKKLYVSLAGARSINGQLRGLLLNNAAGHFGYAINLVRGGRL